MEDTSLDEFLETGGEDDSETDGNGDEVNTNESGEAGESEEESDEHEGAADDNEGTTDDRRDEVEPAVVTARWARTGGVCERCEEPASRLWADDGAFACRDCKEW